MLVLVTGGAGFIGTNLIRTLAGEPDVDVRVLDNETSGKREHIGTFKGEFIAGDIRDRQVLAAALDGVDAVVHLAADTRVVESIADPATNFDVNVRGTFGLLEAMRERGVRRLVNASTGGAIIGAAKPPVHEEMAANPMSPYGASKLAIEGYCSSFAASYGLQPISLRFSNVYGPRSFHKGSVVAAFFKQIIAGRSLIVYGDGSQGRDFIYVDDICGGILCALRSTSSGVVQLGSGVCVTLNELIEAIRRVVQCDVRVDYQRFRPGEVMTTFCDIAKARTVLGFQAATSLMDGLTATWRWFQTRDPGSST